jgi:arginase family enzyme
MVTCLVVIVIGLYIHLNIDSLDPGVAPAVEKAPPA